MTTGSDVVEAGGERAGVAVGEGDGRVRRIPREGAVLFRKERRNVVLRASEQGAGQVPRSDDGRAVERAGRRTPKSPLGLYALF